MYNFDFTYFFWETDFLLHKKVQFYVRARTLEADFMYYFPEKLANFEGKVAKKGGFP